MCQARFVIVSICILFLCGFAYGVQDYPWKEITDRLQIQIDECRRDTRDLSSVERRLGDLEANYLFLEEQLELLLQGKTNSALLAKRWNNLGVGE